MASTVRSEGNGRNNESLGAGTQTFLFLGMITTCPNPATPDHPEDRPNVFGGDICHYHLRRGLFENRCCSRMTAEILDGVSEARIMWQGLESDGSTIRISFWLGNGLCSVSCYALRRSATLNGGHLTDMAAFAETEVLTRSTSRVKEA